MKLLHKPLHFLVLLLLFLFFTKVHLVPSITRVYPDFGPTTGQTVISVWGSGFILTGSDRSDCQFESDQFGEASLSTSISNSSYLECTLPSLDSEIANYINLDFTNNTYLVIIRVTGLDGSSSNFLNFTYFNLTLMFVKGMSPKEGTYYSTYSIEFTASFVPNTQKFACILQGNIYPVMTNSLDSLEDQTFTCNIHGVAQPSLQTIHFSIIYDITGIVSPTTPELTQFIFYSDAPQVTAAYNPSLVYLFLNFDRPVEFGNRTEAATDQTPDCTKMFALSTQVLIGPNSKCSWFTYQQRSLVIELTNQSSLSRAIQYLYFSINYSIRTRYVQYSYLLTERVRITSDSLTIKPYPFILTTNIPSCGVVSFDAGQSQLSGSQNFSIFWTVRTDIPQAHDLHSLNSEFSSVSNAIDFSVNADEFLPDVLYTVTAYFRNFLSNNNTYKVELYKNINPFPTVTVNPPHFIYTDRQHTIYSTITRQNCSVLNVLALNFIWRISTDNGDLVPNINFTNQSLLFLPSASLTSNSSYIITYTVGYGNSTQTHIVQIFPMRGRPVALVLGGAIISVSYTNYVIVDATGSYDPYDDNANLTYKWTCQNSQSTCVSAFGNEMLTVLNIVTSTKIFVIPATFITQISIFDLTLIVETDDNRVSLPFSQKIIFFQPTIFPSLVIIPSPLLYLPANRELILYIDGWTNNSLIGSELTIYGDEMIYYDRINIDSANLFYSVTSSDLYSLPAETNILPATGNAYFRFELSSTLLRPWRSYRFTVTHSNYNHSYDVTVATAPHAGLLTISYAINDNLRVYTLRADSWSDEPNSLPLKYRFGIKTTQNSIHWLTPNTHLLKVDTLILSEMDQNMEFMVRIENYYGSITDYSMNSSVGTFIDHTVALHAINNTLVYSYDVIQGTSIISSILYYHIVTKNSIPSPISTLLWKYFALSFPYVTSDSKDFSEHALFLLNHLILNIDIPTLNTNIEEILNLFIHFFESINDCPPSGQFFRRGISKSLLNLTLEALDRIFTLISENNLNTIENFHKFSVTLLQVAAATRNHFHTSTLIFTGSYFTLKISDTHLTAQYYTTCSYFLNNCLLPESLPYMVFSRYTFNTFYEWDCRAKICSGHQMFESIQCSGVTLITGQLPHSIYSPSSIYSNELLSDLHFVSALDPSLNDIVLPEPYQIIFPSVLQYDENNTNPICAIWDASTVEWDSTKCTLVSFSANIHTCQCQSTGIIGLFNNCSAGFYGMNCSLVCPSHLWGAYCQEACHCSSNGVCRASDGFCDCNSGYRGISCDQNCSSGSYGKFCSNSCKCSESNTLSCSPFNGTCTCSAGWRGDFCNETCPKGSWGLECAETCLCHTGTVECDPVNGSCTCIIGYIGEFCDAPCPEWLYGHNCANTCECVFNNTIDCNIDTGKCLCDATHSGHNCSVLEVTSTMSTTPSMPFKGSPTITYGIAIVIVIMLVIIFIIIIILIIIGCCVWKSKYRNVKILPEELDSTEQILFKKTTANGFTQTSSLVLVNVPVSSTTIDTQSGSSFIEEEVEWIIVELVLPVGTDQWRPVSSDREDNPFQVPEKPIIQEFSLSGHYSHNNPLVQHSMFPIPILLPRNEYTLVDLRNAFVDSGQWSGGTFQFLKKDVPFTYIHLLDENDSLLSGVKSRTVYIQRIKETTLHAIELCVCGRVAESECSHCNERGYCGMECQTSDWENHSIYCLTAKNIEDMGQLNATLDTLASLEFEDDSGKKNSIMTVLAKIMEVTPGDSLPKEEARILLTPDDMLTLEDKEILENKPETDEVMVVDIFK